jgi:hypothetical protein
MIALHHFTLHLLQQDVHSWAIFQALFSGNRPPQDFLTANTILSGS